MLENSKYERRIDNKTGSFMIAKTTGSKEETGDVTKPFRMHSPAIPMAKRSGITSRLDNKTTIFQ